MAREIRCEGDGPFKIEPSAEPVWICGCGLTKNKPFCDGSHSAARKEEPGKIYRYGSDGEVAEVNDDS